MGVSTDGILAFGVDFDEDAPDIFKVDGEVDFESAITKMAGYPSFEEDPDNYFDNQKKALSLVPVELVMYCSYDCPMYILAVKGESYTAYRGGVVEIDQFEVDEDKIISARRWCIEHGIAWENPRWLLNSLWG